MRSFLKPLTSWLAGKCRLRSRAAARTGVYVGVPGAALLWLLFALYPRQNPDLSACLRIRNGMTETDVVALFGTEADTDSCWLFDFPNLKSLPGSRKYWYCDAGVVEVRFDAEGKALGYLTLSHNFRGKPSAWQKVLNWLGL
jgi:hypothetical protein